MLDQLISLLKAMVYLTSQKIVHRDLAARNVLVYKLHHIEVSDFGLARMVDLVDENGEVQVIPTFWAAMEVLEKAHTEAIYNEKTDVWSFGVTCWEILTRTKVLPYEDVWHEKKTVYMFGTREKMIKQIEEVSTVLYEALKNGKRLCQPRNCVQTLWTTILSCN
jgi:serine/threonine protein kinase